MKKVLAGLCVLLVVGLPHVALAIFASGSVVHDPINLVQNASTALRTWASNINEAVQIENQVRQLAQDAQHLIQLPYTALEEIQAAMATYNGLISQVQGIGYSVQSATAQFEALYNAPGKNPVQWAQQMLGQLRSASQTATQAQAIFDQLCAQSDRMARLLAFSKASVGDLQAQQVNNELTAVLIEQQAGLLQLEATAGRVEVAHYMRQAVSEELAAKNAQTYLQMEQPPDWQSRPPRGKALPD